MSSERRHLPPLWVMALGLVAVAANLRTVMASVPPLVDTISADLGLSNTAMGALTTLPVLCMGVFAPTAQRLASRIGAAGAVEIAALCLGPVQIEFAHRPLRPGVISDHPVSRLANRSPERYPGFHLRIDLLVLSGCGGLRLQSADYRIRIVLKEIFDRREVKRSHTVELPND